MGADERLRDAEAVVELPVGGHSFYGGAVDLATGAVGAGHPVEGIGGGFGASLLLLPDTWRGAVDAFLGDLRFLRALLGLLVLLHAHGFLSRGGNELVE